VAAQKYKPTDGFGATPIPFSISTQEFTTKGRSAFTREDKMEQAIELVDKTPRRRPRGRKRGQSGSCFRRGGAWAIVYRTPEGKQKWESGFANKGTARARLTDVLKKINDGNFVDTKPMLFSDFADERLNAAKATLKPSTWASYVSAAEKYLKPRFGEWEVREITRIDVKRFVDGLVQTDLSKKFIKNVLILLHKLFEDAIDAELAASNPAHKIKWDKADDAEERHMPKREDVRLTFAVLPPVYQALLATGAMTGARRAELLGLQWDDINRDGNAIHIQRSLQRLTKCHIDSFRAVKRIDACGLVLTSLKSKKARRWVELPESLAKILRLVRQTQRGTSPFIFQDELARPLDPDRIYDVLHAAQDRAGVERFGLHGLRHLYSSLLHAAGAPVKHAQDRLGHASAQTTLDTYTHSIGNEGREYANAVEAAFPFVSNLLAKSLDGQEKGLPENQEALVIQ
jgi:integrase